MKAKTNICDNCNFCKSVYRAFNIAFFKLNEHYCTKYEILTSREDCCESWTKKLREYDVSPQRISQVEQDLTVLLDYFKDY